MDAERFDSFARAMATTRPRRWALIALLAAVSGALTPSLGLSAERNKRKRQKSPQNEGQHSSAVQASARGNKKNANKKKKKKNQNRTGKDVLAYLRCVKQDLDNIGVAYRFTPQWYKDADKLYRGFKAATIPLRGMRAPNVKLIFYQFLAEQVTFGYVPWFIGAVQHCLSAELRTVVNDGCADTRSDRDNCGLCGNKCGDGQACLDGYCACVVPPCGGQELLEAATCRCVREDGCPEGSKQCGSDCVELGILEHCRDCNDRCQDQPCNIATCDRLLGCGLLPRSGDACQVDGVDGTCINGECIANPCGGEACDYVFARKWGGNGGSNGQFDWPIGVAVDANGYVYVADRGNNRIQKFTSDGGFVTTWGTQGSGDGQFQSPEGIACAGGLVYVLGEGSTRLQRFTPDGEFVDAWSVYYQRSIWPHSVAVDGSGNVFVATHGWYDQSYRILKFSNEGVLLKAWGRKGSGNGEFQSVKDVAVDRDGYVYVVDSSRIQKFTSNGDFVTTWGKLGSGDGEFHWPRGVAVDKDGYVYVTESQNNRIQKFTADGVFVTQWGRGGAASGQLGHPERIAVDRDGFVYVTEVDNDRVQKFAPLGLD